MTFAVKTEPESEEIESDPLLKMAPPNMQNPHVTLENYPFENFSSSFQAILPHATPVNVSGSAEVKMETSNYDEEITRSSFMQLDIPIFIKGEVIEAENIIEEEIPLIDIAQEDFEDGKQKQQLEEHADNKVWKFVKIFKNAKCADEFLRSEKTWSYHYEDDIEEGARIYYKCNKINLEGPECPAELYLLFHKASGAVILYRGEVNHYHLTNLPSNYGINNKEVG